MILPFILGTAARERFYAQLAQQHAVDIQRLWRRQGQGTEPGGVFSGPATTSSDPGTLPGGGGSGGGTGGGSGGGSGGGTGGSTGTGSGNGNTNGLSTLTSLIGWDVAGLIGGPAGDALLVAYGDGAGTSNAGPTSRIGAALTVGILGTISDSLISGLADT